MGENSEIAWTDHTFNPWIGCTKISPACTNCYAAVDTFARRSRANGLELWGPKAARHVTSEANWRKPLAWDRAAAKAGTRARVFCASLADVFEDRPDLVEPRARLYALIRDTPNLDWLLLTKRPEHAHALWSRAALSAWDSGGPDVPTWLPNIWLGTTVEDQSRADERIPHLLATPAAVRFLSCEPLLGPVDLVRFIKWTLLANDGRRLQHPDPEIPSTGGVWERGLDLVIAGGESGPGARPCDLAWLRSLRDQCAAGTTKFFCKQLGARPLGWITDDRKGGDPDEWPEDLRVREMPEVRRGL